MRVQPNVRLRANEQAARGRPKPARVCIITSATVCCNPRVVKEADALSDAGYDVRVVASQHVGWAAEWDHTLMQSRKWTLDAVRWDDSNLSAKQLRVRSGLRQRAFRTLARTTDRWLVPERGYARLFDEQLRHAVSERADLYIAHNPQALPVAAAAAKHHGVSFAFDAEDFHSGEFSRSEQESTACRLLTQLEAKYMPGCAFVTAPSEQIARALQERYQLRMPVSIHNVFNWSEREALDGEIKDRRGDALSLYWYSQVIGLDRGIQDVIRAAPLLSTAVQIHLRGEMRGDAVQQLVQLADKHGVRASIYLHEPVPPEELLSRASEHDVGLALEQPVNTNRDLTVTNKVFHYLLAGLCVAATATTGQQSILRECSEAGFLYEPGDIKSLAAGLQRLLDAPELLRQRKSAALEVARRRWNWESESQKFLSLVESVLPRSVDEFSDRNR